MKFAVNPCVLSRHPANLDAARHDHRAATAIVFAVICFGPYLAAFGLLAGLVIGWGVR